MKYSSCTDINDKAASNTFVVILEMDPGQKISNNFTVRLLLSQESESRGDRNSKLKTLKIYFYIHVINFFPTSVFFSFLFLTRSF